VQHFDAKDIRDKVSKIWVIWIGNVGKYLERQKNHTNRQKIFAYGNITLLSGYLASDRSFAISTLYSKLLFLIIEVTNFTLNKLI
jgi:hypothetical protein